MNGYKEIANSGVLYIVALVIIAFVLVQSIILLTMSLKRCTKMGMTKTTIRKAIISSASVSVLPSVAVAIGFFSLAPILGIPITWTRLSIIGGLSVELPAASLGATAAGASSLGGPDFTKIAFASAVWTMTFATMWHLLSTTFMLKKVQGTINKSINKNKEWGNILVNSIMMGMLSVFFIKPIINKGNDLITLIASSIIMVILVLLMKKFKKLSFLKDFAMPLSMVGSMIFIVLYSL